MYFFVGPVAILLGVCLVVAGGEALRYLRGEPGQGKAIEMTSGVWTLLLYLSLGVLPLDVSQSPIDFLAADGHKWLLGPEGAGIFYIRRELIDLARHYYGPQGAGAHHASQGPSDPTASAKPPGYEAIDATGEPYESFVFQLEEATRP